MDSLKFHDWMIRLPVADVDCRCGSSEPQIIAESTRKESKNENAFKIDDVVFVCRFTEQSRPGNEAAVHKLFQEIVARYIFAKKMEMMAAAPAGGKMAITMA